MASKICWKCLTYCGSPQNCSPVNDCDCGMPFHYLLHPPPCSAQTTQVPNQNDSGFVQTSTGFTVLPVLEVVVGNVLTYALQDSGSTASYITQDLVDKLKLDSSPSENFTRTIIGNTDTNHRIVKTVKIRGKGHSVYRTITNVFVCQQIPATTRRVALCMKQFPYLDETGIILIRYLRYLRWARRGMQQIMKWHSTITITYRTTVSRTTTIA